jgi:hypothetical protein
MRQHRPAVRRGIAHIVELEANVVEVFASVTKFCLCYLPQLCCDGRVAEDLGWPSQLT